MLRIPHLLLLALCALLLSAAPAFATAAPASGHPGASARAAVDDESGDEADDPGDDWGDECVATDEDGNALDESCWDDEDVCDWSVETTRPAGDDEAGDEWGDEGDWDEACDEEEIAPLAPPRLSALHAAQDRRSRVTVSFRLDRAGRVRLALQRTGGSTACAKPARRGAGKARRACQRVAAPHGTVSVDGARGANATTLRRWNGRLLVPGSYRLTATPAGDGGRDASTTFTLRAPARRR